MPEIKSERKKDKKSCRRETKRRRVTRDEDDPSPDTVGSSFRPIAVVDSDATTGTRTAYIPSSKDVSIELCKVDDRSCRTNSLRALKQLQTWLVNETATTESKRALLENFHYYGGIARTLDFLEANIIDLNCAAAAVTAAIISDFLSFRWNATQEIREVAIEMAKTIIRRDGIPILLRANQRFAVRHATSSAKKHIWIAIGRTINGEETRSIIDKTQKLSVLNDATDCISQLVQSGSSIETWTTNALQVVLYAIANTIKDTSLEKEDVKRIDIVPACLDVMKRNEVWERNKDVATYTLGILIVCTKQKTLSKKKIEQLLPTLLHCMSHFSGDSQILSFVLALLESASEKLPKEMMEKEGVLEAISSLLKPEGLSENVKEKARSIMRKILN